MAHEGRIIGVFPESFNQLRKVLVEEHQDIWQLVGWSMVHDHVIFVEAMNAACAPYMRVFVPPEAGIDACCQAWLTALATMPVVRTGSVLDMQLDVKKHEKKSPWDTDNILQHPIQ